MESRTPQDVLKLAKDEGVEFVDLRFCDLPGVMQHFSMPIHELTEDGFEEGYGFDGSSIRGFQEIQESDMLLIPDPNTAVIDPFREHTTLNINCFVHDPVTGESYSRDPRYIAKKAEEYLKGTGIADTAYFGPEAEFYIFDSGALRPEPVLGLLLPRLGRGRVELRAASSSSTARPNLGYKPRYKEGYFPVPPMDQYQDLRSEMVQHARGGRHRDRGAAPRGRHRRPGRDRHALRHAADAWPTSSCSTSTSSRTSRGSAASRSRSCRSRSSRTTARACTCTSRCGRAASRCSSTRRATPACPTWRAGTSAACSSTRRRSCAFTNPTTNSYKRLVPGYEAPVNLVYSQRNRSASVRIPLYSKSPKAKRLEFRCPDPSCNPYLAFAAMLMAGLDGIQNRIEPPTPVDRDLYDLPPEELAKVPQVPGSLDEALDALEADHEFLLAGGVFTPDVIETWIEYKRLNEIDADAPAPAPVRVLPVLRHLDARRRPLGSRRTLGAVPWRDASSAVRRGRSGLRATIAVDGAAGRPLESERVDRRAVRCNTARERCRDRRARVRPGATALVSGAGERP